MYIKKSIASVAVLVVLAAGYVAGSYIGLPNVDNTLLGGDIGKAKAYNEAESPEVQAAMEQLANDTTLQKETAVAAVLLGSKVKEMNELLAADKHIKGIEIVLPPVIIEIIKILQARADNTQQAYDNYAEALAAVMKGEKVENFEQIANNAYLAYTMMDRNMRAASPQIVDGLMEVAEKKENKDVAEFAAKWIEYNAEDAHFENSKERIDYWNDKMDALAKTPMLGMDLVYRGEKVPMNMYETISKTPSLMNLLKAAHLSLRKDAGLNNSGRILAGRNVQELAERNVQELTMIKMMLGGSYEVTLSKNILPGKMETFISLRDNSLSKAFIVLNNIESSNIVGLKKQNVEKNTLGLRWW